MKKILLLFCLFFCSYSIFSSMLKIIPTRIDLSQKEPIAIFEVENVDTKTVALVQSQIMHWTQRKGKDLYHASQAVLMVPPMFRLKPGQKQMVRFALRGGFNPNVENSYRVFLSDLMPKSLHNFSPAQKIQMKLRISVPIFIAPLKKQEKIVWQTKLIKHHKIQLSLLNQGNVHIFIDRIQLFNEKNKKISPRFETFSYILPKAQKTWILQLSSIPKKIVILADNHGDKIKAYASFSS